MIQSGIVKPMIGYNSLKELPNADPRTQSKAGFIAVESFFAGSSFQIPGNQRPYVWEKKQVDDLIDDILKSDGTDRYFGSIVLTSNGPMLDVVDGQQRITTFSLLAMAFRDLVQNREIHSVNFETLQSLEQRCELILASKSPHPRLHNANLVFNELLKGNVIPDDIKAREAEKGKKSSGYRIISAYEQLRNRIVQLEILGGDRVQMLFDNAFTASKLVCVIFSDPTQANQLFESLNARGKALSPADNVKNDLVAAISNNMREHGALRACINLWNDVTGDIEIMQQELGESGVPSVTEFMHLFTLAHTQSFFGQTRLKKSVEQLIEEHRKQEGVSNAEASRWFLENFRNTVRGLRELSQSKTIDGIRMRVLSSELRNKYGYLWYISAYQVSPWNSVQNLPSCLRDASTIAESFALYFKITGMKLGIYQKRIHRAVSEIMYEVKTYKGIGRDFHNEFDRDTFLQALGTFEFSDMKFAHFLLNAVEESLAHLPLVEHGREWSVEHIVPQNPKKWGMHNASSLMKHKKLVNRLGNLTLIASSSNSHLSNKSLEFKLSGNQNGMCKIEECNNHYDDSPYQLTKRIGRNYVDFISEFERNRISGHELAISKWCAKFIEQRTSDIVEVVNRKHLWSFKV